MRRALIASLIACLQSLAVHAHSMTALTAGGSIALKIRLVVKRPLIALPPEDRLLVFQIVPVARSTAVRANGIRL